MTSDSHDLGFAYNAIFWFLLGCSHLPTVSCPSLLVVFRQFIESSKRLSAEQLETIKKLQDDLLDTRATSIADKCELEATVKESQAKLQTTQIALVRVPVELRLS